MYLQFHGHLINIMFTHLKESHTVLGHASLRTSFPSAIDLAQSSASSGSAANTLMSLLAACRIIVMGLNS